MVLDKSHTSLHILPLITPLFLYRLPPAHPLPLSLLSRLSTTPSPEFYSITRNAAEISVVLSNPSDDLPLEGEGISGPEGPWRALKVQGPFEFSVVGIIAELSGTLARGEVSVFVISTWDTDFVLVKEAALKGALDVLEGDGWVVKRD